MSAADALAYVDKTLDSCRDLPADIAWTNAEVVVTLDDIRKMLISGMAVSPDCRDGKCGACTGEAWDEAVDGLTTCTHECHESPPDG